MKIFLFGYGKMGKAIETIALDRGHTISGKVTIDDQDDLKFLNPEDTDVMIEFTQPDMAPKAIKTGLEQGVPVISGTTGWLDRRPEIETFCKKHNGAFFYASNYSIGVNLFFRLSRDLAKIMNAFEAYDVSIEEVHHTEKKDAPSGTAITLAEGIIKEMDRIKSYTLASDHKAGQIPITAIRENAVPGTHTIKFESEIDDITLIHKAHSRQGFALGAILVSEWIKGKKGIFTMDDFLP